MCPAELERQISYPGAERLLPHLMHKIPSSLIDASSAAIIAGLVSGLLHGVRISKSISPLSTRLLLLRT